MSRPSNVSDARASGSRARPVPAIAGTILGRG